MSKYSNNYRKEIQVIIKILKKRIYTLKKDNLSMKKKIYDQIEEYKELEKKNEKLKKYINIGSEEFQKLESQVREKEENILSKEKFIKAQRKNFEKLESFFLEDTQNLKNKISFLNEQIEVKDYTIKEILQKKEGYEKKIESLVKEKKEDIKKIQKKLYDKEKNIKDKNENIKILSEKNKVLEKKISKKINLWVYDFLCENVFYKIEKDHVFNFEYAYKDGIFMAVHFEFHDINLKSKLSLIGYIRFFKYLFNQVAKISYNYYLVLIPYYGGSSFFCFWIISILKILNYD